MQGSYELRIEKDHLLLADTRPVTPENVRWFLTSLPQQAREAKVNKVLADLSAVTSSVGTMDRFKFANDVAKHFVGLKLAIIPSDSLRDPENFEETVAVNRGANFHICRTREEAYAWLGVEAAE